MAVQPAILPPDDSSIPPSIPGAPVPGDDLPKPVGWVDRLTAWIDGLPLPAWVVYLLAALMLNGFIFLLRAYDGTLPAGRHVIFHLTATSSPVVYILLIHYLDRVALVAFRKVEPVLTLEAAARAQLAWRLTHMPASVTWLATGVGALVGFVAALAALQGYIFRGAFEFNGIWVGGFGVALSVLVNATSIVFVVHVLRQLRMINYINRHCVAVDLYNREPLYAFSILTATTAVSWIATAYVWVASYPGGTADVVNMAYAVVFSALSLVTFIWPLWSIHRRLDEAKIAAIGDVVTAIRRSTQQLHVLVGSGRYDEVGPVGTALSHLRQELDALEKIPTWPWRPETARTVYTAIFLPMLLWFLTRLVERILTG